MLSKDHYNKIFQSFKQIKALVIGDVILDAYIWGKVDRVSPEAPVPVVSVTRRENRLGGASNVALNVAAMGAEVVLCSVVGSDTKGDEILQLMENNKLITSGIIRSNERTTTTKFRIIGNHHQMLRVDEELNDELNMADEKALLERVFAILEKGETNIIIFEDYDKGVLTPSVIEKITEKALQMHIPVTADPKFRNFKHYRHLTLFKPNLKELSEGLAINLSHHLNDELKGALTYLHASQDLQVILTTLSEYGVLISYRTVSNKVKFLQVPSQLNAVSDVSGAGDTMISVASLCLSIKLPPDQIAVISNIAGGQVCREPGVVPVNKEKLLEDVINFSHLS